MPELGRCWLQETLSKRASKQVVSTPHEIPRILGVIDLYSSIGDYNSKTHVAEVIIDMLTYISFTLIGSYFWGVDLSEGNRILIRLAICKLQ